MDIIKKLAEEFKIRVEQVEKTVEMIDNGDTIPFIARYRKELHGAMDDTALRTLEERLGYLRGLQERKEAVKKSIEEQGKLTEELKAEIEKAEILKKLGNKKYTLQRSKGLGENEPEMMWQTTMNPETRRLIQIMEADKQKTDYIFETLLGDDLPERKRFIADYGTQYLVNADI